MGLSLETPAALARCLMSQPAWFGYLSHMRAAKAQADLRKFAGSPKSLLLASISRLAPVLKPIFHQCVISYTCSQSNSDGSPIRVRLATSI